MDFARRDPRYELCIFAGNNENILYSLSVSDLRVDHIAHLHAVSCRLHEGGKHFPVRFLAGRKLHQNIQISAHQSYLDLHNLLKFL